MLLDVIELACHQAIYTNHGLWKVWNNNSSIPFLRIHNSLFSLPVFVDMCNSLYSRTIQWGHRPSCNESIRFRLEPRSHSQTVADDIWQFRQTSPRVTSQVSFPPLIVPRCHGSVSRKMSSVPTTQCLLLLLPVSNTQRDQATSFAHFLQLHFSF